MLYKKKNEGEWLASEVGEKDLLSVKSSPFHIILQSPTFKESEYDRNIQY